MDKVDSKLLTKKELLSWANHLIKRNFPSSMLNFKSIDDFANGVGFCYLLDIFNPGKVKLNKLNHKAKLQHENLTNLKILSTAMFEVGIDKKFDTARIATKKANELLELLQWFRKYFFTHNINNSEFMHESNVSENIQRRSSLSNNMPIGEKKRVSMQNIKTPASINQIKLSVSQKRLPSEQCQSQQMKEYKNCYKINKEIQKIVHDQVCCAELKLQLIKKILFKNSIFDQNEENLVVEVENHIESSEKNNTIPEVEEVERKLEGAILEKSPKQMNFQVKIQQNLLERSGGPKSVARNVEESAHTSLLSNRTSLMRDSYFILDDNRMDEEYPK